MLICTLNIEPKRSTAPYFRKQSCGPRCPGTEEGLQQTRSLTPRASGPNIYFNKSSHDHRPEVYGLRVSFDPAPHSPFALRCQTWLLPQQYSGRFRHPSTCLRHHHTLVSAGRVSTECTICVATEYAEAPFNDIILIRIFMCAVRASAVLVKVADEDAVTISFVTERSVNGVRTVDVVRALQSDTIQDVKLRLRTRGHHVTNGHALVSTYSHSIIFPSPILHFFCLIWWSRSQPDTEPDPAWM